MGMDITQHGEEGYAGVAMVTVELPGNGERIEETLTGEKTALKNEEEGHMRKIEAIIRPEKLEKVKEALGKFGIRERGKDLI